MAGVEYREAGNLARVHPSAMVASGAVLGRNVEIGPFCIVGAQAELGDDVQLMSHVVIAGHTSLGARTRVFPFVSLGHEPQDLKYGGESSALRIGADCLIREGVTMNPGTKAGGLLTSVGDKSVFLAQSHVAHDCRIGSNVVLSNNVMLAGHCQVGDRAILGGGAAVHQFARIGENAFVGGLAGVEHDVIPFGMALGNRAHLAGLNIIGMKRQGFAREKIHELRRAYRTLFGSQGTLRDRVDQLAAEFPDVPEIVQIVDFVRDANDRAICTPRDAKDLE